MGGGVLVDEEVKALAVVVFCSGFVVEDGENVAVVEDIVHTEPVPSAFGKQWIDFDEVVGAWSQADESGDDEVAVRGMVIVFAAFPAAFSFVPGVVLP